jgi:hypothetical protein
MLDKQQYQKATDAHHTKTYMEIMGDLNIVKVGKSKTYVMNHVKAIEEKQLKLDLSVNEQSDDDSQETE